MPGLGTEHKFLISLLTIAILILLYASVFRIPGSINFSRRRFHSDLVADPDQKISETLSYDIFVKKIRMRRDGVLMQISMHVVEPKLNKAVKPPTVVLLHGHGESSKTWDSIGTLEIIGKMGHVGYAIDLPGSGDTRIQGKLSHYDFLHGLFSYLSLDRPLLISASSSGSYAFDYLFDTPGTIRDKISGFIALSPIQALAHPPEIFEELDTVYTVFAHGDKEADPIGEEGLQRFRKIETLKIHHIRGAGHLHYRDRPDMFHQMLVDAINNLQD